MLAALGLAVVMIMSTGPGAGAASSSTVVSATIPSMVSLTKGCTASSGWNLGTVMPGSTTTTATGAGVCRFTFSSSNDSAMLRIGQKDAKGTAMASSDSRNLIYQGQAATFKISMATATVGWAEGDDGTLHRTSNGSTWTATTGPGIYVHDILAVNATTVIVVGYNGTIRRWTDGSGVWTTIASGTTEHLYGLAKTSASNLYGYGTGSTIIKSTDGGASWTSQVIAGDPSFQGIAAAPGTNTVYMNDMDNGRLFKTTDGVTWTPTPPFGYAVDVSTFDGTTVYATSASGMVWSSNNGGTTWISRTPPGIGASLMGYYYAVEATAAGTAYVFGLRGALVKTTDSGNTWTAQAAASTNTIRSATSVAGSVWGAGSGGVIVNTTDGTNWTRQRIDASDLFGVSAVNGDIAYTVGGSGTIRKTTNGGSTWNTQTSGVTTDLNAVSAVDATHAFAVGAGGRILATTNGTAWSTQVAGPAPDLRGVAAVDVNTAWVVGDSGTILKTTNGGATWTAQNSTTSVRLHAVAAADLKRVYAVGDGGTILKTVNGGTTWAAQTSGTGQNLLSVTVAPGSDDAWAGAANSGSNIQHTTDGGATPWQAQYGTDCCSKFALSAVDARHVYLGEHNCSVGKTSDGGATFDSLNPAYCGNSFGVSAVDANLAFFVGDGGAIAKTQVDRDVNDYGGGSTWASAPGVNAFGVCVQDVALSAVIAPPWVEDTATTPGVCNAVDTEPWAAIPTALTKLATTAGAGQSGQVDLVWGFKAASTQPTGTYTATVLIEALAPNT